MSGVHFLHAKHKVRSWHQQKYINPHPVWHKAIEPKKWREIFMANPEVSDGEIESLGTSFD